MALSREDIGLVAKASADEILKCLGRDSNPSPAGIDINKLPGFAYFWGSTRPFTIVWGKHKDGTVSFTSLRLTESDLAEFVKE